MSNEVTLFLAKASTELMEQSKKMADVSRNIELLREWFAETNAFLEKCHNEKIECPYPLLPGSVRYETLLSIIKAAFEK